MVKGLRFIEVLILATWVCEEHLPFLILTSYQSQAKILFLSLLKLLALNHFTLMYPTITTSLS